MPRSKYKWHVVVGGGNSGYYIYTRDEVLDRDQVVKLLMERDRLARHVPKLEQAVRELGEIYTWMREGSHSWELPITDGTKQILEDLE